MPGYRAILAGPATFDGDATALQALVDIINEAYKYGERDIFHDGFQRATPDEVQRLARKRQLILVINASDSVSGGEAQGGRGAHSDKQAEEPWSLAVEDAPGRDDGEDWQRLVTEKTVVGCMKLIVHEPEAGGDGDLAATDVTGGDGEQGQASNGAAQHVETAEGLPLSSAITRVRRGEVGMFAMHRGLRSKGVGSRLFDAAEARSKAIGCDVCELQLLYPRNRPHAIKDRLRRWYTRRGYGVVASADFCAAFPRIAPLVNGPVCFDIYHKPLP